VTPAAVVLAIAVAAWGPAAPPHPATPAVEPVPAPAPPRPPAPAVDGEDPNAPRPVARARPEPFPLAIIAKAPIEVRAKPVLVDSPDRRPAKPLYKRWGFWLVSGGLFATTVIVTILATRPKPEPYTGNVPPFTITFP
jgi:hypothetical protein